MIARAFPGILPRIKTYEEYVCLYLNTEWERVARITETSDAVKIGLDKSTIPNEWIDLLTEDEAERVIWRLKEFQKEL